MSFLDKTGLARLWANILALADTKVPNSRAINGKILTSDISLTASDVDAYTKTEIDNLELITVDDIDTICGATIEVANLSNEVTF